MLAEADVDRGAALVLSSARALRSASADPRAPIGVVGFSMGASWGLWLSARSPIEVAATVAFYGTQSIDFGEARSAYLGHFAEFDALVPDDEVVELEAHLQQRGPGHRRSGATRAQRTGSSRPTAGSPTRRRPPSWPGCGRSSSCVSTSVTRLRRLIEEARPSAHQRRMVKSAPSGFGTLANPCSIVIRQRR